MTLRRAVAALGVVLAVAVAVALPAAAGPDVGDEPPAQATAGEVTFAGVSQTPWVGRDDTWQAVIDVSGAPAGATLEASIRDRVETRQDYLGSIFGDVGDRVVTLPTVDLDTVTANDGRRRVTLAVTLRHDPPAERQPGWSFVERGLRPGVYPIDVQVLDDEGDEAGRIVLHLTRVPTGEEDGADAPPFRVAPLVRLGVAPDLDEAEEAPEGTRGIDDLTAEVEGLTTGLGDSDWPVTLVPRPESLEAMARTEEGTAALADLRDAATDRQVVDGPYVDVPIGAWVGAGMTDELTRQRDRGHSILATELGRVDSSTWDATTNITPDAASALWPVGVRTLILGQDALDLSGGPLDGPVTVEPAPGQQLTAVVPDASLSDGFTRRADPVLDASGLAAELAIVAADRTEPGGAVVAPSAGWSAEPAAVEAIVAALTDPLAPVETVTLSSFLTAVPDRGARALGSTLQPDLGGQPGPLAGARAQLASYASLVGATNDEVAHLDRRILLAGSSQVTATERNAVLAEVDATTRARFDAVQAPERQRVTLTSSTGDLPLTVVNDLDVPVEVMIDLRSEGRVEFRGTPSMVTVLEPGRNRVPIPVRARAPGDSTVDVVIRTTDGTVVVDEVRYTVRSSAVSGIGIVLSGGAVVFLVVWWVRHAMHSRRDRRDDADRAAT